jgi:enoyl-CoA hydratase/carnithine racemase
VTPMLVPPTLTAASVQALIEGLPDGPVALRGTPGCFCRGMDLDEGPAALTSFSLLLAALSARVSVAVVDGEALGGGVGLAAACDLVIVTQRARFGLPEVLSGLLPAVVTPWIVRRVGPAAALALSMGLVSFDAAEALRRGLADLLTDEPEPALDAAVRRLACADPRAVRAIKRLFATHHAPAPAWWPDAASEFDALARSPQTRARLALLAAGDAPWLGEQP